MPALFSFARKGARLAAAFAIMLLALAPAARAADWPMAHRTAANDAYSTITAFVAEVANGPTWQTSTSAQLMSNAALTVAGGVALSVSQSQGSTYYYDSSDDTFIVRAYDPVTGDWRWDSSLPPGASAIGGSLSAPAIDAAGNAAYIGAGSAVYKLNLSTGAVIWSCALTSATTAAGRSGYDIINSSPVLADGKVFVEINGGNYVASDKQIVAIDATAGTVSWFHNDGGEGYGTPCVAGLNGGVKAVCTATTTGIAAYNAATGAQLWSNLAPLAGTSWTLRTGAVGDIQGDIACSGGKLYAATYSFSGTGQRLICVDAATGQLLFNAAALSSDVAPVVMNGKVYVQGGVWGAAELAAYDAGSGAQTAHAAIGGNSYRTQMAAANSLLYMTDQTRLLVINPDTLAIQSSASGAYNGGVALDDAGRLYVHNGEALAAFREATPVELSSFSAE